MMILKSSLFGLLSLIGAAQATVQGFDISNYQPSVNFAGAYSSGARFVIIKATEGTTYTSPSFSNHYVGATNAGFIRGAYHFAHPGQTTAAAQADFFIANGGGWSRDGITLPGMLDLENESGYAACWGLSASSMVAWIKAFSDRYQARTGRYPMLYTNPSWWSTCTGNSAAFVNTNPLVLARYASAPGTPPGGWAYQTIWQNSDSFAYGGDSDIFNGSLDRLVALATG
ncbi:glycoside hydrolase family 25 protein [Bombardia bombarda]|uniref:N,O-diacetylmuramidase n=1 Tax=Bombardia bombarda TaxID=252184 RepID=A0AA39WZJ1_9PEZI|nr:glycoside hydrolase family 25 protein [Bombardia bombarda]